MAKFFHKPLGGGEVYIHNVLRYLVSQGIRCTAVCFTDGTTLRPFERSQTLNLDGIHVFQSAFHTEENVRKILGLERYDAVITQSTDATMYMRVAKSFGIKTVFGIHFYNDILSMRDGVGFTDILENSDDRVVVQPDRHHVFHDADAFFVNSDYMEKVVQKYVGVEPKHIIYPPIRPSESPQWPEYVTYVNPCIGKGMGIFCEVATRLPQHRFMMVGALIDRSPENMMVYQKIQKLRNVTITGESDMAQIYQKTKVLMVPSLVDETFSMVTLEAGTAGIPVVATPRGNLPYLVTPDIGKIVPESDLDGWVLAVNSLLEDDRYRDYVTPEAKENFRAKYDPEVQCQKFLSMLQRLCA